MEQFLINNRLQDYCDIFQKEGYDDLEFLQTLTNEELKKEFIVNMGMKKGHYAKLFKGIKDKKAEKATPLCHAICITVSSEKDNKLEKAITKVVSKCSKKLDSMKMRSRDYIRL